MIAALAAAASLAFVPAPPTVQYARGVPEGVPADWLYTASYNPSDKTVYFVGALDRTMRGHELGHAFDFQVLTDGDRTYFMRVMGLHGPWNNPGADPNPIEAFADWYGNDANRYDAVHSWDASYTSPPTALRFRRFKQALARLGHRYHLKPYT